MKWKLILLLSIPGFVMAIATVFWIPSTIEPFFWLVIFIGVAYFIAKKFSDKYFLHGFFVSLVNSAWITGAHILFSDLYLANHPQEAAMITQMPLSESPRLMMLITGPIVGIISGIVLGLFALIASKLVKRIEKQSV